MLVSVLTPDCHHGTTGPDTQRVGYAVSRQDQNAEPHTKGAGL